MSLPEGPGDIDLKLLDQVNEAKIAAELKERTEAACRSWRRAVGPEEQQARLALARAFVSRWKTVMAHVLIDAAGGMLRHDQLPALVAALGVLKSGFITYSGSFSVPVRSSGWPLFTPEIFASNNTPKI